MPLCFSDVAIVVLATSQLSSDMSRSCPEISGGQKPNIGPIEGTASSQELFRQNKARMDLLAKWAKTSQYFSTTSRAAPAHTSEYSGPYRKRRS